MTAITNLARKSTMFKLFFYFCFSFCFYTLPIFSSPHFEEPWGKDSNLKYVSEEENANKNKNKKLSVLGKAANAVINFHQKVLSPIDGPRSHFRPSSSRYMQLAIKRYGFFRGYLMGCDRLLRENGEKWVYRTISNEGGSFKYDPAVSDKFTK